MPFVPASDPARSRPWRLAGAAGTAALLLSACGGGSSSDEDGGTDVDIDSIGRLALYDSGDPAVAVLDLDSGDVLRRFALPGGEARLYTSPGQRYAVAVQRDDDRVSFVDGGLYTEDHFDHFHDYAELPALLDFTLSGTRPTHYSAHEGQGVIFFDAQDGVPSTVTVLSDADVAGGSVTAELTLANSMHGAAKLVDDRLFVTFRDPSITDTVLPAAIERYALVDGTFTLEQRYEEPCPRLHGHAANEEAIVFGCGDGVLVVDLTQEGYPATKLANPESMAEEGRVGTVYAHTAVEQMVGAAGDQSFVIDPDGEPAFRELPLPDGVSPVAQGFNVDGETYYLLGDDGMLRLHDVVADWSPLAPVAVADRVGEEDAAPVVVASAAGERLFVLNTNGRQVIEVDSIDGTVVRTIDLDFTATRLAWLGLPESRDDRQDR